MIYSFAYGSHALTAVPTLTRLSTIRGTVLVDTSVYWWAWLDGWHPPVPSLHSSNEPGELSHWLYCDDCTINIIVVLLLLQNCRYRGGAGNTAEENSRVFSLIRMS